MKPGRWLGFACGAALGAMLAGPASGRLDEAERPNLVLFLSDDHGVLDTPVYGGDDVRTPYLERLAAEGLVFDRAFVGSPSCVPSRAVLMSGLMPARNGAQANHTELSAGVATLPTYLDELGYQVVHFGKGHFQPPDAYRAWTHVPSEIRGGPLNADLDTDAVAQWLADREASGDDRPVCLVVCSHSPHVYWPENDGYGPDAVTLPPSFVDTRETRRYRTEYYTDVTRMDRRLGDVRDAVRTHLGDNTLFLYTSDHGAQWPFGKWNLYDAGIRVPFVAAWPGVIAPGRRTGALISAVDLLPTFVELAGGTPPEAIDGRSYADILRGTADSHRDAVFAAHTGDGDMNVYPMRAVRTERFKYIRNLHPEFAFTTHIDRGKPADGLGYWQSWLRDAASTPRAAAIVARYRARPADELYDLDADPHELLNLAEDPKHRQVRDDLSARLDSWMSDQGDLGEVIGRPRLLEGSED